MSVAILVTTLFCCFLGMRSGGRTKLANATKREKLREVMPMPREGRIPREGRM